MTFGFFNCRNSTRILITNNDFIRHAFALLLCTFKTLADQKNWAKHNRF